MAMGVLSFKLDRLLTAAGQSENHEPWINHALASVTAPVGSITDSISPFVPPTPFLRLIRINETS
jgi:hypothetical protein